MSRTYKDKPAKDWSESWGKDRERIEGTFYWIDLPTTKTKKRKEVDTEEHWMGTPGWWIRCMMNKPQRRAGSIWEREVVTTKNILDIDLLDTPSNSRRPHIYYW